MINESLTAVSGAYTNYLSNMAAQTGIPLALIVIFMGIVSIWSLCWKGVALWKASKKNQLLWFAILLVVNTMGILEILYIFVFSKIQLNRTASIKPEKAKATSKKKKL
jgi:hypothetical protein